MHYCDSSSPYRINSFQWKQIIFLIIFSSLSFCRGFRRRDAYPQTRHEKGSTFAPPPNPSRYGCRGGCNLFVMLRLNAGWKMDSQSQLYRKRGKNIDKTWLWRVNSVLSESSFVCDLFFFFFWFGTNRQCAQWNTKFERKKNFAKNITGSCSCHTKRARARVLFCFVWGGSISTAHFGCGHRAVDVTKFYIFFPNYKSFFDLFQSLK